MIIKTDRREYDVSIYYNDKAYNHLVSVKIKTGWLLGEIWQQVYYGEIIPYKVFADKDNIALQALFQKSIKAYEKYEDYCKNRDQMLKEYK